MFWYQRSRVSWLKYGDRNTKFFHSKASQRRRRNFIEGIKNANGVWVEEVDDVADVAFDYFMNIFKVGTCDRMEECLNAVNRKMTKDMLEVLSRLYNNEEVKAALFQMGPTKAPRPDRFTSLLAKAEIEGSLHGVALCRSAPPITNFLFVDDSLIFCQANKDEVQVVSDTLQLYPEALAQCINLEKSSAYFSSNVSMEQKAWIIEKLKVKEVEKFNAYLGLPTLIGRRKYKTSTFLKERIWRKLQGWKGKLLSRAGKEVLIKAVAQSIPTYTMGFCQLPGKLCDELDTICARFWWGQIGEKRKIHWKNWSFLTLPKKEGGMGFRNLRSFNLAMLAKQGWRLLRDKSSLLNSYFKAKYFLRCDFLEATGCQNSSYVWKSLLAAQPILWKGCLWRVGNGASIRVLKDC
ncbi:uncharacterized protein LOC136063373 [Quercus suber]|uniref:uncharacterized protein LOC136063373 n=1 Tax=Quercus suber TaxID=58331 RepID=UPI0032DFA2A6